MVERELTTGAGPVSPASTPATPAVGHSAERTVQRQVAPSPGAARHDRQERQDDRVTADDVRRWRDVAAGSAAAAPADAREPSRSDAVAVGDIAVRPSVLGERVATVAEPTASERTRAERTAGPERSVTRHLLRRTLADRTPARPRRSALPTMGAARPIPAAIDRTSHASAIETVMRDSATQQTGSGELPDRAVRVDSPPIAERFMTELSRQRAPRPGRLPERFHEMSTLIAGTPQVRVAADVVSRQALRSVGKVAATVDDVIHLDRPIGQVRSDVIAHELTHVAHRSPEPRFFDDDRPSREEQRAESVAKLMRSSATPSIVRRSPSSDPAPASPGAVSAESLAAQIMGGSGNPGATVQRQFTKARPRGAARGVEIGGARAAAPQPQPQPAPVNNPAPVPVSAPAQESAAPMAAGFRVEEHFERILEMLQDRVLAELERRGGRLRGGL